METHDPPAKFHTVTSLELPLWDVEEEQEWKQKQIGKTPSALAMTSAASPFDLVRSFLRESSPTMTVVAPGGTATRSSTSSLSSVLFPLGEHCPRYILSKKSNYTFIERKEKKTSSIPSEGITSADVAPNIENDNNETSPGGQIPIISQDAVAAYFDAGGFNSGTVLLPYYHLVHRSALGPHIRCLAGSLQSAMDENQGDEEEESRKPPPQGKEKVNTNSRLPFCIYSSSTEVMQHLLSEGIDVPKGLDLRAASSPPHETRGGEQQQGEDPTHNKESTRSSPSHYAVAVWTACMIKKSQERMRSDQWFYVGFAWKRKGGTTRGKSDRRSE